MILSLIIFLYLYLFENIIIAFKYFLVKLIKNIDLNNIFYFGNIMPKIKYLSIYISY